jgi:hypothetical protein
MQMREAAAVERPLDPCRATAIGRDVEQIKKMLNSFFMMQSTS